ncbi:hypothetical protein M422DRAFT_775866 [Sphaerobolus stellatus SS14]|nr:hypothetical protein M422DRAFT_775866 [Sphaerobolus stellatus SS14]
MAQVEGSTQIEPADRYALECKVRMIDILNDAIGDLSEVPRKRHPSAEIPTQIQESISLSDNETLMNYTIAFLAFRLISFPSPPWTTDVKLFRVVLHAKTNPDIRFAPKIYDILWNLAAFRKSSNVVEGIVTALRRPYEVAVFTLCMDEDFRFFEVLDSQNGVSGIFSALKQAYHDIANENGKGSPETWLCMYKTLHAICDMFLQVFGMHRDLDMDITLLKLVLLKPPRLIRDQFRHMLVDAIAAVFF